MDTKKIAVVGTVRNCASTIENELRQLKQALVNMDEVHYFLVESDSSDDTLKILHQLERNTPNFSFVSLGSLKKQFPLRTQRIAHCRNRYLDELQLDRYADIHYLLITDLDGTNTLLTKEAIASCWQFTEWDVITANQLDTYYDIFALRHPLWCPTNWREEHDFLINQLHLTTAEAFDKTVRSRQYHIPASCEPIAVDSAFGGLAIYKKSILGDARYHGLDAQGNELCEHVSFHEALRNKGARIFINPKLINCKAPSEHVTLSNKRRMLGWIETVYPNFVQSKLFKWLQKNH